MGTSIMIMNFLRVGGFQVVLNVFVFSVHLKVYSDPYYFLHLGGNIVSMGMIGRSGMGEALRETKRLELRKRLWHPPFQMPGCSLPACSLQLLNMVSE